MTRLEIINQLLETNHYQDANGDEYTDQGEAAGENLEESTEE